MPAAYPGVLAVGAVESSGARASYSQYGSNLDLVAPGGDEIDRNSDGYVDAILQQTFDPNTRNPTSFGYWFFTGTSMAAPHVSGLAALLLAQGRTSTQTIEALMQTQQQTKEQTWLGFSNTAYGLINAQAAVKRYRFRTY